MKIVTLEPVEGEAAQAVRAMLTDRDVRVSLFACRGNVDADSAWAIWRPPPPPGELRMAVRCHATGKVVGAVGIVRQEISFFISREFAASGYGHAAIRSLVETCARSDGPSPLIARTVRENTAARRIFGAAGFREKGIELQDRGLPCLVRYELNPR